MAPTYHPYSGADMAIGIASRSAMAQAMLQLGMAMGRLRVAFTVHADVLHWMEAQWSRDVGQRSHGIQWNSDRGAFGRGAPLSYTFYHDPGFTITCHFGTQGTERSRSNAPCDPWIRAMRSAGSGPPLTPPPAPPPSHPASRPPARNPRTRDAAVPPCCGIQGGIARR